MEFLMSEEREYEHARENKLILSMIDYEFLQVLKSTTAFLAGGALTSIFSDKPINDFDIYSESEKDTSKIYTYLKSCAKHVMSTDFAETFDYNGTIYQIISMPSLTGSFDKIFDMFDFTVCMAAYVFSSEKFYFHNSFFKHLAQRRIVFNNKTPFPLASLVRTKKYMAKGYTMSNVETVKLAMAINKLDLTDYKVFKSQLMGIDASILKPMIDKLAEMSIIDKEDFLYKVNELLENAGWMQNQD